MKNDRLSKVTNKVEDVKIIMHDNIERAAQNCVKLEELDRKAEEIMVDAGVFKHNATKLREKMQWKNIKYYFVFIIVVIIIFAIIFGTLYPNSSTNSKS